MSHEMARTAKTRPADLLYVASQPLLKDAVVQWEDFSASQGTHSVPKKTGAF